MAVTRRSAVQAIGAGLIFSAEAAAATAVTPAEARAIARDATIYGFPMVDNYRVHYSYFIDASNPEFKAPYNTLFNIPRVFTPADIAIQTPNSDTPYSWIGMDLRAEPMVFTVPAIEPGRYWSLQLIDLYTHNFDYLGSRATGNGGGSYMIAGPGWQGPTPPGITKVIRSETKLLSAQFRTQLFDPGDLEKVKAIQNSYVAQPLSSFLRQPAPQPASAIAFPPALSPAEQKSSLAFFDRLNFLLQFAPTHPSETALMARFAQIGVGADLHFDPASLTPEMRQAMETGMVDAWASFDGMKQQVLAGTLTSGDLFGTRAFLNNDYLKRMTGAVLGIYGNTKQEAMYPAYYADSRGQPLDGTHRYTLRFAPGQLPPVNSFWSLTMYSQPASLLVANPINRYLLNSPMMDSFSRDPDGGLTLVVQHEAPPQDQQANWLPAPNGPFSVIMRLYWPKEAALDGSWLPPGLERRS
jgi:hypothetical protein